jgi:hypothetical protein
MTSVLNCWRSDLNTAAEFGVKTAVAISYVSLRVNPSSGAWDMTLGFTTWTRTITARSLNPAFSKKTADG